MILFPLFNDKIAYGKLEEFKAGIQDIQLRNYSPTGQKDTLKLKKKKNKTKHAACGVTVQ